MCIYIYIYIWCLNSLPCHVLLYQRVISCCVTWVYVCEALLFVKSFALHPIRAWFLWTPLRARHPPACKAQRKATAFLLRIEIACAQEVPPWLCTNSWPVRRGGVKGESRTAGGCEERFFHSQIESRLAQEARVRFEVAAMPHSLQDQQGSQSFAYLSNKTPTNGFAFANASGPAFYLW